MNSGSASVLAAATLSLFSALCATAATAPPPHPVKQDVAWKRYVNKELGYCFTYPKRWIRDDAYDGAGMSFETGVKKFSMPIGEIDIVAAPASEDLKAVVEVHLEGVKKFVRARNMEILEGREMSLAGNPALFTKDRYVDPLDKATWIEELVLTRYNKVLYRLEMVCRADNIARFEPVFARFVRSFQFDCNARH